MIKYNTKTINDWNFDDDNIIKVYRNGAVVFYKVSSSSGSTPTFKVCYAVVDDITQYQETEFVDVYDKKTKKWYKLNNLNQYEEYGLYGSGRDITYYEGKLTIYGGYEYQWNGSSWVNVGEITETTATLPDVPFSVNYNAKNYDANTKTLLKTEGQLVDVDAVITAGTPTVNDGYLTIETRTRATISGYQTYFNRTDANPNMTIISKQRTNNGNCHMFANRDNVHNWMYRCYSDRLVLHGSSEQGQITVTTQPVIESVRVNNTSPMLTYNNYTDSTSSTLDNFNYGNTNSGKFALFQGYATSSGENFSGDFYWVYMSQYTLTDEQVQQVIDYNEGGTNAVYPLNYDEKPDPLDNLSFESLDAAQEYAYNNCVYDGMRAMIGVDRYYFDAEDENGWVKSLSYYQVNLNSQWQTSTSYGSISDTGNYDFYQSFSNKGVHNSTARMFITINGYKSFTFKVRNYSESGWDYVVVNNLDDRSIPTWQPNVGSGTASSGYVYYSNAGKSSSTTWYDVTFNNLDGGEHTITVTYGKDSSASQYDDRGYVAIPKTQ